ncbi:L,D-transpeptidase family protein [Halocynthiibacter sp. C4]|uniref:L,D-transpeptidase family protein n=2 Tax=Halocynthiibacter sp. C4 TaxID=2992758 RepID=UPI00237C26AC|nr:L,D-transpeptidase family protein [Halocynthiibacter sp. C4]MDE0590973.1 L,D-transpeptidase family protein [Halocynthiibacter sp. C4]
MSSTVTGSKMRAILIVAITAISFVLSGCGGMKPYNGPEVTRILVYKEDRKMFLMHHDKVLKSYDIHLGFEPVGHKQYEGDGKTPEGSYLINRRNPNSDFYLSIGMSYPNTVDVQRARAVGKSAGGDIFIHGESPDPRYKNKKDWTWGCIAVTDKEMEEIYPMVNLGTVISVYP